MSVSTRKPENSSKMLDVASKISAIGFGMIWLLPNCSEAHHVGFEIDNSSGRLDITVSECYDNPNPPEGPWDKWITKNEKSYSSVDDCLTKYVISGKRLIDCVDSISPYLPM